MIASRAARTVLLAALPLLAPPTAGAEPPKASAGPPATAARPPKLGQSLKLDPALAARLELRAELPTTERLDSLVARFKAKYAQTKAALETQRRVTGECLARAYTPREQQDAGCRPEDSMQACSEKLLCECRYAARHAYLGLAEGLRDATRPLLDEVGRLRDAGVADSMDTPGVIRCRQ